MDPLNFFGVLAGFPGRAIGSLNSLPLAKKSFTLGAVAVTEQQKLFIFLPKTRDYPIRFPNTTEKPKTDHKRRRT
jgi:hypothetical protein